MKVIIEIKSALDGYYLLYESLLLPKPVVFKPNLLNCDMPALSKLVKVL